MTRLQRNFLAIAILFFAWFFHVNTCDWHFKAAISFGYSGPVGANQWSRYPIWTRFDTDPTTGNTVTTGLTTEMGLDLGTGWSGVSLRRWR